LLGGIPSSGWAVGRGGDHSDQPHMPHSPLADTSTKQFGHIARVTSRVLGVRRTGARSARGRDAARGAAAAGASRRTTGRCSAQ